MATNITTSAIGVNNNETVYSASPSVTTEYMYARNQNYLRIKNTGTSPLMIQIETDGQRTIHQGMEEVFNAIFQSFKIIGGGSFTAVAKNDIVLLDEVNEVKAAIANLQEGSGGQSFTFDDWVAGAITGTGADSNTVRYRIRTNGYHQFPINTLLITPATGFNVKIVRYTYDSSTYTFIDVITATEAYELEINHEYYYRFSIVRATENTSETATVAEFLQGTTFVSVTDISKIQDEITTLKTSKANVSDITLLESQITDIQSLVGDGTGSITFTDWVAGTITSTGGNSNTIKYVIRTDTLHNLQSIGTLTITPEEGWMVRAHWYMYNPETDSYDYVGPSGSNYSTQPLELSINPNYYYKFAICRSSPDTSEIATAAFAEHVTFTYKLPTQTQLASKSFEISTLKTRIFDMHELNPFKFKPFDKAYITFVIDDALSDVDAVVNIFQTANIPVCLAVPPDNLGSITSGTELVQQVCERVVANGGEILTHSHTVITDNNVNDELVMTQQFLTNKKMLIDAGFDVNGIILTGGTGAISGAMFLPWLLPYYKYSNYAAGTAYENYALSRTFLGNDTAANQAAMDAAVTNHTWLIFYTHSITRALAGIDTTQASIEAALTYVASLVSAGTAQVVNYKYMYDTFKSTVLEERIAALEPST